VGQPVKDRRSDPRYGWSPDEITRATLRPGCRVHVVDLSAGGALVQGERPLRPGAHVHFQIVTRLRRFALSARVLRCEVWMLDSSHGVTYRGALQFEERCDLVCETETHFESLVPVTRGMDARAEGTPDPNVVHRDAIV
jgi:hypothetical protein